MYIFRTLFRIHGRIDLMSVRADVRAATIPTAIQILRESDGGVGVRPEENRNVGFPSLALF